MLLLNVSRAVFSHSHQGLHFIMPHCNDLLSQVLFPIQGISSRVGITYYLSLYLCDLAQDFRDARLSINICQINKFKHGILSRWYSNSLIIYLFTILLLIFLFISEVGIVSLSKGKLPEGRVPGRVVPCRIRLQVTLITHGCLLGF